MSLSNNLRYIRERVGLSQLEVAKITGIGNRTISDYERGITNPDPETLKMLAKLYNVSIDYLLDYHKPTNEATQKDLEDIQFAFYGEPRPLTDEDKKNLIKMINLMREIDKDRK